ncbi:hypothetical protein O9X98_05080 [Agrobacterium salinitolerans]|nr:hypothetical protein [Agrobacterium salinitolerans]
MNQTIDLSKFEPLNRLAQNPMADIKRALKRACEFVNVEPPVLEGEVTSNRIKTPFDALFSFKFEATHRFVNCNVNAGDIPVVGSDAVAALRDELRNDLRAQFTTEAALRARTAKAEINDGKLFETDYAVCKDTCAGCSGAGSFHCSPCGGYGQLQCNNCFLSGYVRCTACSGRGGHGDIPCTYCGSKGSVVCHRCNGTIRMRCDGCGGRGLKTCGGCQGDGIVSTVYRATLSMAAKLEAGPTALSKDNLSLLRAWVVGGFPKLRSLGDDDGDHMETDVHAATVHKGQSDLDYKVSFNCYSTVSRLDFMFEGKKAWVERSKTSLPFAQITFSNFLDTKVQPAIELAGRATTPSAIRKALKDGGFPKIAAKFDNPDEFTSDVKFETSSAVSTKAIKPLEDHYNQSTGKFAKGAMRRAWKLPVLVSLGGWAAACHYDIPQAAADMESPLWMAGLAFVAGFITLLVSNFEARYSIVTESKTLRGWRAGFTQFACAIATAALFWTSSYYGFKI